MVRYYGLYANRSRRLWQQRGESATWTATETLDRTPQDHANSPAAPRSDAPPGSRRASWARLLRRILEVDPLLCPRCQVEMVVVSVITEPAVVDRILNHRDRGQAHDPFAERAPPPADALNPPETTH